MREGKLTVEYIEVAETGHCGPLPLHVMRQEVEFVAAVLNARMYLPAAAHAAAGRADSLASSTLFDLV